MRFKLFFGILAAFTLFVAGCEEPLILPTTGTLTGKVTDANSGQAVQYATVNITGKSFTTGADGKYTFNDLPEGNYTVEVSCMGYTGEKKQFFVTAGKETVADFALYPEYAEVNLSTSSLDFGTTLDKLTFEISKPERSSKIEWYIEKQSDATWLSFSETSGTLSTPKASITVYLLRSELTEDKVYSTDLIVKIKNGGSATLKITAQRKSAQLAADPTSIDFGSAETEKSILLKNATQEGTLNYKASPTESWIIIENPEGAITNTDVAVLKVKADRSNLAAGTYNGTIVIATNRNTVTVPVSMQVLGQQAPDVNNLQCSEVKYSSVTLSAYISSIGSSAVTALGFCWSTTNPEPTVGDNKNNMGGTTVPKSYSSTITGLVPNTKYYFRAYATNEVGTSYSSALALETIAAPTYAVVKTLDVLTVGYDSAEIKGTIEDLGDGYVTSYGFCYSTTDPNPTLDSQYVSLGSTATKGDFQGKITNLAPFTKYYVRAFATNSVGTAYGGAVQLTTLDPTPVVTSGLLAYYTFDKQNCDDFFGEVNYCGVIQGTSGNDITFTEDTPSGEGYALKGSNGGKYYKLLVAPECNQSVVTYCVWLKTKSTTTSWVYENNYASNSGRGIRFKDGYLAWARYSSSDYYYFSGTDLTNLLLDGQWHHMAFIFKRGDYKLYIDGRFIFSSTSTNPSGTSVYQGKVSWLGLLNGLMDNLRIYNRALTQEEVTQIKDAKQ